MAANNLNGTTNSLDGELKENLTDTRQVQQDSDEGLDAKTGGQVKGGVVASSGDRMQDENESGPGDN